MKHYPQIVKVLDAGRLVDCDHREHDYRTGTGRGLAPGFQVVTWPDEVAVPAYDEDARFLGPFKSYGHARLALERQLDLLLPQLKSAQRRSSRESARSSSGTCRIWASSPRR